MAAIHLMEGRSGQHDLLARPVLCFDEAGRPLPADPFALTTVGLIKKCLPPFLWVGLVLGWFWGLGWPGFC